MKRVNYYLTLLFILFLAVTLPTLASADTNVSGIITVDTTWTLSDSPYVVTGNVLVNSGVTLTVEPGVIVRFDSGVGLQIDGTLIAIGTDTDNIIFTSNQATPAAGDWAFIFFTDSSTDAAYDADGNYTGGSILEYCVVEYAGSATSLDNNGALRMDNAHPFVNYCTIRDNSASGISAFNLTGTLKVTSSTISDNNISGIITSGGTVGISNNTFSDNIYGGISVWASTSTISNNTINNNGYGISAGSTSTISNNTINNNGYGIRVSGGTVSDNTISNNTGSGIIFVGSVTTTISNNIISNNYGRGIKLSLYTGAYVTVSDNTISNNTGSGISINIADLDSAGVVTISSNTISNNTGSGIFAFGANTVTIFNNTINNNTGSGIYAIGSGNTVTISNNTINNNTVSSSGGGIYYSVEFGTISGNTIANNTASESGGGIYARRGTTTISNNSIIGNSAENASAVYYSSLVADQDFKNNIITGNIATGIAPTYTVSIEGNPLFNYNDIFNNTATYELWNNNELGSDNVDATNNWWGTIDESEIQAKIYDWFDDISKGAVDYYPYLESPVTPIPNISVNPTSHDFGDIYTGESSSATIFTISNTGTAELVINGVNLTGTNPSEFSIQNDNCSGVTIAISGSCTVEAVFSPAEAGELSANLSIDSNDPYTPTLDIELTGTGLSSVTNNPPSIPELVYPEDGQTGLGTTVTFKWKESTDPDGDTVTYDLYVCENEDFSGCDPAEVIVTAISHQPSAISYYAGIGGSGAGLLLFGVMLAGGIRDRRKIGLLIAMVIITGMLLVSCGVTLPGDDDEGDPGSGDEVAYTVSDINPNTTYYWQVVADDGNEGTAESETRSFSASNSKKS